MAALDNGAIFRLYSQRQQAAATMIDWGVDTIKFALGRASALTSGKAITGATNATPIVITATSHGYANGDWVQIWNVGGNANANGFFKVASQTTNTFELTDPVTGANIAGSGTYTSGGIVQNLTTPTFLSDLSGSWSISTTAALSSKTNLLGVLKAAATLFASVSVGAACDFLIAYKDTGSGATSGLILIITKGTGLPVTPNGADINLVFDATNGIAIP